MTIDRDIMSSNIPETRLVGEGWGFLIIAANISKAMLLAVRIIMLGGEFRRSRKYSSGPQGMQK